MADYADPQAIADVQWVAERREDAGMRLVLADRHMNPAEDPRIAGSVVWRWSQDMQHPHIHDIPDKTDLPPVIVPLRMLVPSGFLHTSD